MLDFSKFKPFDTVDWHGHAGASIINDKHEPLIQSITVASTCDHCNSTKFEDVDVIIDNSGVSIHVIKDETPDIFLTTDDIHILLELESEMEDQIFYDLMSKYRQTNKKQE